MYESEKFSRNNVSKNVRFVKGEGRKILTLNADNRDVTNDMSMLTELGK